ncbi:hypothetical protein CupriaWKF_30175 [Cupriavidus sp. WKF15]|uniref:hypothetical protein n=1 Tax=Cupriavidus sp. WKF15 TaxID=3032282 RepID=UPI0023E20D28|nr:hypothetical protein [Cupriavidus sp. WKF15]WER50640.1 hypothetical protein CupriaWKF_30175 [Cupriavidus sp. WKF15]
MATLLSLAFVVSVLTTAISIDSYEQSASKASILTNEQRYALYEKCQQKLDPVDFASVAYGLVTAELTAAVEPFIEGYKNGRAADVFLIDEQKEIGEPQRHAELTQPELRAGTRSPLTDGTENSRQDA